MSTQRMIYEESSVGLSATYITRCSVEMDIIGWQHASAAIMHLSQYCTSFTSPRPYAGYYMLINLESAQSTSELLE
jgi:hypothetical protein